MSPLGERIKAARAVVTALEAMCPHSSTHPACDDPGAALICDDCGIVARTGIISFTKLGDE